MSKIHEASSSSSGTPLGAVTNTVSSKARQSPQVLPPSPLWQTPVAYHHNHHQTHLQTPDVPQSHEPHEQTDSLLSSRSSQSPSRHQRAADPRRESTVLFKGFSASTAESGLLEVDEIAHINGSPELAMSNSVVASAAEPTTVEADPGGPEHNVPSLPKQAVGTGPAAAALARQSQGRASPTADTGGVRRSVGMRDSMCLFLQLEGAVEGENGFQPEEVLQLDEQQEQQFDRLAVQQQTGRQIEAAAAKSSSRPHPEGSQSARPSRLKKPTNTSGFFSSGRSFTGAGSNSRPDFSQSLMSAAAASKSSQAAGPPSLARVSAPSVRAPPGPSAATASGLKAATTSRAVMQAREAALESSAPSFSDYRQGHSQQGSLARPSISAQSRQGTAQLPPSGAPAKSGKSKGVMASVLGSVKKAVGIKSRTKDMQGDDSGSPQPERSAISSMGFTRSQPSQSRLPSFSGLRSKASSNSSSSGAQAGPQRSGMSFGRRQPSFTREATPPLSSEVEELLRNEELAFQGRGGGVGNSPADRAAKEASLRQSAQERHWQDYAASLH
ncbi:hypothetical protein WJX82_000336 [Trebouxia sp. C0006]